MPLNVIIIGGGITGLGLALSLMRLNQTDPTFTITVTIYELRSDPTLTPSISTLGGAIHLMPNALRLLEYLGILDTVVNEACDVPRLEIFSHRTGAKLGEMDFDKPEKFKYRALRVMRSTLVDVMRKKFLEEGGRVRWGMELESIEQPGEEGSSIRAVFSGGEEVFGDLVVGCDGIHSAVRMKFVDPDRKPVYSGIATAYGFSDASCLKSEIPFESTGMFQGRRGSLLTSYCTRDRGRMYAAAVMETDDVVSKEGWKLASEDQEAVRNRVQSLFRDGSVPCIGEVIEQVESFFLYPVYKLPAGGKWVSGRILLMGDAAHAMPPMGESVGLCLEDAVLFSRILRHHGPKNLEHVFDVFEKLRRPRIDAAFKEADMRWETNKDLGWFFTVIRDWFTAGFMWWMSSSMEGKFAYDVLEVDLKV
ncbi:FAD/NAD(P)-binding domain-containing protein [Eremomyces bilateralis CBS 781.70]|uniref:FAD/NAD(P)-binding domain-containing protein n=1 Tax=Eremomyces bilateralis CBS 781.70 TaxID=1392243 RepID=A0A6G1GEL1_9PEZI|nr:FAD/NAD(P)-binding domain-containing protein [Eremomyces bilateralis CBS 781.70]KAF1816517.1 FAD/NAD(P)-binding domain-containing protein [Eremomyces bilateralis CBS 781.70]